MENNNRNSARKSYVEEFNERYKLNPKSEKEIFWIAEQLIEWAKKDDSITLLSFHGEYLIPQRSLYDWELKYDCIRDALRLARSLVGARREKLALENKFNAGIVNRTLGIYDESVKAHDREMKLLASQGDEKAAQTIKVVMQNMPSTDVVPKRGRKKNVSTEDNE